MNCINPNLPASEEVELTGAEFFALKKLITGGPNEITDISLVEKCLVSSVVMGLGTTMHYAVNRYGAEVLNTFGVQVGPPMRA